MRRLDSLLRALPSRVPNGLFAGDTFESSFEIGAELSSRWTEFFELLEDFVSLCEVSEVGIGEGVSEQEVCVLILGNLAKSRRQGQSLPGASDGIIGMGGENPGQLIGGLEYSRMGAKDRFVVRDCLLRLSGQKQRFGTMEAGTDPVGSLFEREVEKFKCVFQIPVGGRSFSRVDEEIEIIGMFSTGVFENFESFRSAIAFEISCRQKPKNTDIVR